MGKRRRLSAFQRSIRGVAIMCFHAIRKTSSLIIRICILLILGMFVSAQQVSSESIFESRGYLTLDELKTDFSGAAAYENVPMYADTLEMYDIELEEEERNVYKEIAVYVIIAAVVGYLVVTLIKPDEEEAVPEDGKEPPVMSGLSVQIPFNRSP
jgi:uncharacterized membrane protein YqjE